jgi:hypothetical protein
MLSLLRSRWNDAEIVGARERGAHLLEDVDAPRERHGPPRELGRERRADEVLHDEVELALFGLADVVDVDDVGVIDAVGRPRLTQHPRPEVRLAAQIGANQLERHDPVDEHVPGSIDDPHAALAEPSLELVAPGDDLAEHRIRRFTARCALHARCSVLSAPTPTALSHEARGRAAR